jgi:DNA polymerase III gamma/tau subunit
LNNEKIKNIALDLLNEYNIPKSYLYILKDNLENIKIQELKEFIKLSQIKSPYKFQIFFIENISRLTLTSSNSLLKILEEP